MTTSTEKPELFDPVESAMCEAILVAFDGCHKIYVAMDEHEANWFRENYEHVFMDTPEAMLEKVKEWYDESCFLRFVNAVRYNPDDPNAGFTHLISQFADQDDEDEDYDDEDEDEDCDDFLRFVSAVRYNPDDEDEDEDYDDFDE